MIICKAQSVSRGEPANITCSFNRDLTQFRGVYYVHRYDKNNQFKEILNCAWTQDRYKCDEDPNYTLYNVNNSTLMLRISSASDDYVGSYVCQTTPADMDHSEPCMFELRDSSTNHATTLRSLQGETTVNGNGSQTLRGTTETEVHREEMDEETEGGVPLAAIVVPVLVVVTGVAVAVLVILRKRGRLQKLTRKQQKYTNDSDNEQGDSEMGGRNAAGETEVEMKETDQLLSKTTQPTDEPDTKEDDILEMGDIDIDTVHSQKVEGTADASAVLRLAEEQKLLLNACRINDVQNVRDLVEKGVGVNCKGEEGETPLHEACKGGCTDLFKILLSKGARIEAKDSGGMTPLHWACRHGKQESVNALLVKGADVNAQTNKGATALHFVCEQGLVSLLETLLNAGGSTAATDSDGLTPLHWACRSGKLDAVRRLLHNGADVNVRGSDGKTPFHIACQHGQDEVLTILLEKGYNFEMKDERGMTALRWACENDISALKKQLLDKRADIFAEGEDDKNSVEVSLAKLKYEDEIKDMKGMIRALHWACKEGHDDITKALLDFGADVNAKDKTGTTPLHLACKNDRSVKVLFSSKSEVDTEAEDETGKTPLHWACEKKSLGPLQELLLHGVNVNARDTNDWTPLHFACKTGSKEAVVLLCGARADVKAKTKGGLKPKKVAKKYRHPEVIEFLKDVSKGKSPPTKET
ncbi:hypothetical protein BaRGS_00031903 [Batillaria attramentaria]|uniref:Ig-like domain-containing protein n=1 Tax=Batillaria attramentaria TaxID=370345 RepID=A0ABD0JQ07_9CAEN